jgi:hypothetical protein
MDDDSEELVVVSVDVYRELGVVDVNFDSEVSFGKRFEDTTELPGVKKPEFVFVS